MRTTTCIVCESTGSWAAALRREVDASLPLGWIEARSPAEARDAWRAALREGSRAVLVAEISAGNAPVVCRLLVEHETEVARSPRMVVAGRAEAAYEGAAREAGATAFCTSPRETGHLAAIIARFAAAEAARPDPPDERSTAERLRAALPWPGAAR
jgi:hypothetical protein